MSDASQQTDSAPAGPADFRSTHWSVVLAASHQNSPAGLQALAKLCSIYWYPLYAYVRRRGHDSHEAEDLTQEFFIRLLQRDFLQSVSPEKGRFRSFLLASLKHFLANEWHREQTQKRGGGVQIFSLDEPAAVARYQLEPADDATPESIFERRWALTLLESVINRLRGEYVDNEKGDLFAELKVFLSGQGKSMTYAELAAKHGVSESAVKMAVHRLRQRYGELLRLEIAQTVATPEEVNDEIRYLIGIVAK